MRRRSQNEYVFGDIYCINAGMIFRIITAIIMIASAVRVTFMENSMSRVLSSLLFLPMKGL